MTISQSRLVFVLGIWVFLLSAAVHAATYAAKPGDCAKLGYDKEKLVQHPPEVKGMYLCSCNSIVTQNARDLVALQIDLMRTGNFVVTPINPDPNHFQAQLRGYEEIPPIASAGRGLLDLTIGPDTISYLLKYPVLPGSPIQAHIHFGRPGSSGGIVFFLCSNLGNGPAGTPSCPAAPGEISGTLTMNDVVGNAASQGISSGDFRQVLRAIQSGVAYVDMHSDLYPSGEIRGQIVLAP